MLVYRNDVMQHPQRGFVLFVVLIILQLVTLLGCFCMMNAVLKLKESRWQLIHMQTELAARSILVEVADHIDHINIDNSICLLPVGQSVDLSQATADWRSQHACSDNLNEIRYDYVLEALDADPCAVIATMQATSMAAYYRVTLWVESATLPNAVLIMQATVAVPVPRQGACENKFHVVTTGLQTLYDV